MAIASSSGPTKRWNRAAQALFGFAREEILGRPFGTLVPPADREKVLQLFCSAARGEVIDPHGVVSVFYRGLGRPQGLAFDRDGNLFVAASLAAKNGIVKITPDGNASIAVSGSGLVGLAFAPGKSVVLATTSALHHLAWDIAGLPLSDPS